jgi:ribosomal protein S18 acetylase RimI-like enzyme
MELVDLADEHVPELMRWFPDRPSCAVWGGPEFRYPFTEATFREDVRLDLPSFSVVGDAGELLGFGQYYLRAERCHLARLVVAPQHRGRGAGTFLIRELCRRGCRALNVKECSLFVLESNLAAFRLYCRLGFRTVPYPGEMPSALPGCLYMVRDGEEG